MSQLTKQAVQHWMAKAIKLAERGLYSTTPNPNVGCVILDANHQLVGEGYHARAGQPHAEVHALEQAGKRANNGTAFVTLEPCSHYGKTGPCAKALAEAGIRRVFIATVDPNPLVQGNGIELLKSNGIEVTTGILESEANKLNLGFFCRMQKTDQELH